MLIDEAVLTLNVQVRDPPFVEKFKGQDDRTAVKLGLRLLQETKAVQRIKQLSTSDELHEEVHVVLTQKGADEFDHEGVVELSEDAAFKGESFLLLLCYSLPLIYALQSVAGACGRQLHHLHNTEATATNDPQTDERVELNLCVLKRNAVLHVVEDRPLHHIHEGLLVHLPQLRVLHNSDGCAARLAEEERSLAHVIAHAKRADVPVPNLDRELPGVDDVEVLALLTLGEDCLACCHVLHLQRGRELPQLLTGKRPEDDHLPQRGLLVVLPNGHPHGCQFLERRAVVHGAVSMPCGSGLQSALLLEEFTEASVLPDGKLHGISGASC
mmetsp:Transcript_18479/g.50883  ORF Transcript_18479/g.50883 Transcript_18479/m.50883 type:complete len:327 (-) Transcript_18479:1167-2147(-)